MRRPHVFQRSAPRGRREAYRQPPDPSLAGRTIAAQLAPMIDRATGNGLRDLAALLDVARREAERLATLP